MELPPKFRIPVAPFVSVPEPARVVDTVSVPELVLVPDIVTFGIEVAVVPVNVVPLVEKVCTPVPAMNVVALLVKLLANVIAGAADSFHIAPLFRVTAPVKVLVPVALLKFIVPVTDVALFTLMVKPPTVSIERELTVSDPKEAVFALTVTVKPPSIITSSPATGTAAPDAPPDVADHVPVEFQFPVATEKRFAAGALSAIRKSAIVTANTSAPIFNEYLMAIFF